MNKLTTFMMSMVIVLMLGCSARGLVKAQSSHLTSIDTVSKIDSTTNLTDTLTDTAIVDTLYSQAYSQLFATTLDYVSRISKVSCTDKDMIANTICNVALENDIDICFILAQGTIETHLGTTGIGKSRHSIFGVYRTYKDYETCIIAYAALLKKSYLTKGRTEKDLMRRYVTTCGGRYAEDRQYEQRLRTRYQEILRSHGSLLNIQKKIKELS